MDRLRFHWRLPAADRRDTPTSKLAPRGTPVDALPDFSAQLAFCQQAERYGIDSLLTMFSFRTPDPTVLVAALSAATERINLMLAHRPGLMSPPAFVQQVNTIAALSGGRINLNVVMGHTEQEQRSYGDFLSHAERYRRADEFLSICHALWRQPGDVDVEGDFYHIEKGRIGTPFVSPDRSAPEIFFGGGSPASRDIAARHADCWLRLTDAPDALRSDVEAMRAHGVQAGIRATLVIKPTHDEAVRAAFSWVDERDDRAFVSNTFIRTADSTSMQALYARGADGADHWPRPWLWTGAVRRLGPSAICLVGTPEEIAEAIDEYRQIGVSQFIFSGWPEYETLCTFGEKVLPLISASV